MSFCDDLTLTWELGITIAHEFVHSRGVRFHTSNPFSLMAADFHPDGKLITKAQANIIYPSGTE
ncbi:MAG: hypothetical protein ACR2RL_04265 [Gammaproteobacteria bacterium]